MRWKILYLCGIVYAMQVFAADMRVPTSVTAGEPISIETSGHGQATALVVGPSHIASKRITLGKPFELTAEDLADAGRYVLILSSGDNEITHTLTVTPGEPAHLSFVSHPSRAPVSQKGGITATVYAFDDYSNLITAPLNFVFKLSGTKAGSLERQAASRNGVATVSMDSPRFEGPLTFEAATGNVRATRVVRVVADEACTLRIHAVPQPKGIRVQTDPVKDCSGNPVPDGTVVTFTEWDAQGRSTIDSSVKKGIASADLPARGGEIRISAASGVALGNEIRLRGAQ